MVYYILKVDLLTTNCTLTLGSLCIYKTIQQVKMDQNTRVTLYANSKTGNIEVGSTFLHNTKISSSAYHENQAHMMTHKIGHDAAVCLCMCHGRVKLQCGPSGPETCFFLSVFLSSMVS